MAIQAIALAITLSGLAPRTVEPVATFDSGMLHVERFGNPAHRAVVFIPALFCGSWQWNRQIDDLSTKYDVVVVTLPGFDGRPMVAGDSLVDRATHDIDGLIKTHHLQRPIVVGHSLGGTFAVLFGKRYPSDASAIITVEGGYPEGATQKSRVAATEAAMRPYEGIPRSALGAALRKNLLQYTITRRADVDAVEKLAERSDPAAIVAWGRAALILDTGPHLSDIKVPLTAIVPFDSVIDPYQGFKSLAAKWAAYTRWLSNAPRGEVIMVDHSRHFVMFDQPAAFERALDESLAR